MWIGDGVRVAVGATTVWVARAAGLTGTVRVLSVPHSAWREFLAGLPALEMDR